MGKGQRPDVNLLQPSFFAWIRDWLWIKMEWVTRYIKWNHLNCIWSFNKYSEGNLFISNIFRVWLLFPHSHVWLCIFCRSKIFYYSITLATALKKHKMKPVLAYFIFSPTFKLSQIWITALRHTNTPHAQQGYHYLIQK